MTDDPRRETQGPDLGMLAAQLLFGLQDELFARLADGGHDEVRPRHGAILAYLDADGVRATELARRCGRHKQVVGRLVDELEALGYVRRRPDPLDRRAKLVALTECGLDEQRQGDAAIAAIEARHAERLGAEEYAGFRAALLSIVEEART